LPAALPAALLAPPTPRAADVGYAEDFALAADRAAALARLIPGTEDYYYYHCLHLLNTGQLDKLDAFTRPWVERHGHTARVTEVQVRHHLLAYEKNPKASLDFLVAHLGLRFDHQREVPGAAPDLPTTLDQGLLGRAALTGTARARGATLETSEDRARDCRPAETLPLARRPPPPQRLRRPALPNLPRLIADDLKAEHAQPFGSFPVHAMLTVP